MKMTLWQRIRAWFKDSETIFFARLQILAGILAGSCAALQGERPMSALIALIGPKIIGPMAIVLAAIGLAFQQHLVGAKAERAKQAQKEAEASDIGHQVDNDLGAMTPAQAREALQKWSKH